MRSEHGWIAVALGVVGLSAAPLPGCGSDDDAGDGGSGGVSWSTSSATGGSGGAGAGGRGSTTSSGAGGDASSSGSGASGGGGVGGDPSATSATATSGSSSSGSGGGSSGRALVLAGGSASFVAAVGASGIWTSTALTSTTNRGIALVAGSGGTMGVWREAASGAVHYATFDGNAWSTAMPVGPGITTQGAPSLAVRGNAFDLTFHGDNFKHYFGSHTKQWSPTAEEIKPQNQGQSFGPVPGAIGATGTETVFAFPGDNGVLYEQSRLNGAWQPAAPHGGTAIAAVSPALATPTSGSELLVVYAQSGDKKLKFATRLGGMWGMPATVHANAFSDDPPALASLPNGAVFLVFRGTDGKPYTCRYEPNANPPWSEPKPIAANNPTVVSTPSVAAGIDGHDVELAYIGSDAKGYHTALTGSTWSAPTLLAGSGLLHIAIATQP